MLYVGLKDHRGFGSPSRSYDPGSAELPLQWPAERSPRIGDAAAEVIDVNRIEVRTDDVLQLQHQTSKAYETEPAFEYRILDPCAVAGADLCHSQKTTRSLYVWRRDIVSEQDVHSWHH